MSNAIPLNHFFRVLATVPRAVFVHSLNGRWAAAMILVKLGLEQGTSGADAVLAARGLGITCTLDSLGRFAEAEIDRRIRPLETSASRMRP